MARARREPRSQSTPLVSENTALMSAVQENLRLLAELRTTARSNRNGGPLGRQAQSQEIAPLFVYLASDESSYMTAQSITIDGGVYNS